MASLTSRFSALRQTDHFARLWKYASVSIISTGVTQVILFLTYHVMALGSAMLCNVIATVIASVPAYYLNRNWTWGKRGKSDVWREIVPFWTISFIGLVLSTIMVGVAAHNNPFPKGSLAAALFVNFANLITYAFIWVGRYLVFNRFMFGHAAAEHVQALADEATNAVAYVIAPPSEQELADLAEAAGSRHAAGTPHAAGVEQPVGSPSDPAAHA